MLFRSKAQGEDVVAGIRTPNPLNEVCRTEHSGKLASLELDYPDLYRELDDIDSDWKNITTTCWILNLPSNLGNYGCCSAE